MKKTLASVASFLLLALFVYGVGFDGKGPNPFFPSLRLLENTQWDVSFLWTQGSEKAAALLLLVPIGLGFVGWTNLLRKFFSPNVKSKTANFLGFSLSVSLFSLYVFGLGINEILNGFLAFLFFVPALWDGWLEWKELSLPWETMKNKGLWLLVVPLLLWLMEYLSPPLIWDAVLDHFRYAREVSRLHLIPLHWTNHTGDMPKAAELILAGFWSIGGECFSKLSSGLAMLGLIWLLEIFLTEEKRKDSAAAWIFLTCPFFLAIFAWGYVEGFLAFFEMTALYCFWKGMARPQNGMWGFWTAYFLGFSFSIKYTALLAIGTMVILWVFERFTQRIDLKPSWFLPAFFLIPILPWLLKNCLAYGNPLYPLASSIFGISYGYGPGMEGDLWRDTGTPQDLGIIGRLLLIWKVLFTPENAVGAVWTPLVVMSLPWVWRVIRTRLGLFLGIFGLVFFGLWMIFCTSLRHASGGSVALVLLAAMAWKEAFERKVAGFKFLFVGGTLLSLWLCLSAQLTTTAPYASAFGVEDPRLRLKRNYSFDTDTYAAYRFIEDHSDPNDKVLAFAVFQTYPLQRTAFVDFKWKRPIFLQWASQCKTAEQLAQKLHEEGVRFFLYQQWEATAMSRLEKGFELEGMPVQEYERFWRLFMEPVEAGANSTVYEVETRPLETPRRLDQLPGLQERGFWRPIKG